MEDLAWGEWELRIEMSGILSWGWIFKALDENYIKKTQGPSYWPHYDWRNASCRQGTCPHSTLPAASDSSSWWDLRLSPEIICYKILSQVWPSMSAPLLAASLNPGLWLVSELPILTSYWSLMLDTDLQDSKSKLFSLKFKVPFPKCREAHPFISHLQGLLDWYLFPRKTVEKYMSNYYYCLLPRSQVSHVKWWCTGAINSKVNFVIWVI